MKLDTWNFVTDEISAHHGRSLTITVIVVLKDYPKECSCSGTLMCKYSATFFIRFYVLKDVAQIKAI